MANPVRSGVCYIWGKQREKLLKKGNEAPHKSKTQIDAYAKAYKIQKKLDKHCKRNY